MAQLLYNNDIPCTVVGHFGDYIHYCKIDNDTPGVGSVADHMLVYVFSGELIADIGGQRCRLQKGQASLLRRNHRCKKILTPLDGEGFEGIFIHFKRSFLKKNLSTFGITLERNEIYSSKSTFIDIPSHSFMDNLFSSIRDYFNNNSFPSEQLIEVKLMESILTILELCPELKPLLFDFVGPMKCDIVEWMEQNYLEDLTLEEMAKYTGRSLTIFKREAQLLLGTTPKRWITRRRLQEAKRRIEELGELPIEASERAGFKGYSHFSQAFKREYGINPSKLTKLTKL